MIVRLTLSKAGEPLEYDLLTRSSVMTASEPSRFFFFSYRFVPNLVTILIFKKFHVLHVLYNHECDLECNRILKYAQIQPGRLLKLIQTIYQRISVDKQLTARFRYV